MSARAHKEPEKCPPYFLGWLATDWLLVGGFMQVAEWARELFLLE
jgi:hypothetical protein